MEGEEAGDLGVQLALWVLALALEIGVDLDRAGHDHAVGRGDRAAWPGVAVDDLPVVVGVLLQPLGSEDLQVVELGEQQEVADHQPDAEAADLSVHAPTRASSSSRRSWRVVTSSETRISSAIAT